MIRQQLYAGLLLLGGGPLLSACLAAEAAGDASGYLREDIYDTAAHADEALVNVRVAASRWPDCTTLESAVADIFRLEGVTNKPDQDKALALWKWFRILVSATGGSYAYEGPRPRDRLCRPAEDLHGLRPPPVRRAELGAGGLVAGRRLHGPGRMHFGPHHGRAPLPRRGREPPLPQFRPAAPLLPLGRAEPARGHAIYPGDARHGLSPPHAPQELHSLRTSLRVGESVGRLWQNKGYLVPSGKDKIAAAEQDYYAYARQEQGSLRRSGPGNPGLRARDAPGDLRPMPLRRLAERRLLARRRRQGHAPPAEGRRDGRVHLPLGAALRRGRCELRGHAK